MQGVLICRNEAKCPDYAGYVLISRKHKAKCPDYAGCPDMQEA